ncbi:MAG TPA: thiamine phosphate synthase [Actinomycetota bacterium]|nr:thiamine phosphate synthase [Actinomycetota bacterium]
MKPGDRHDRLARARLYVVSGAREKTGDLREFLDAILSAGVDIVQLREKHADAAELIGWGKVFRETTDQHDALFIVNDHPGVALAVEADGVHVGQLDLPPAIARRVVGNSGIVGLSTHSREQWDGPNDDADYLCAGPVWETPTKPGRPAAGLDYIQYAAKSGEERPWFAIGGIDQENLPEVVETGARRIVVVRAITEAKDPAAAVTALVDQLPSPD